jgi:YcaO-like protein with predicted kinase domain
MPVHTPPLPDASFKDATPQATIARIKGILANHGIETEVVWNESGVPYCHSLRVNVCGTSFGTCGKGVSEEFALASGYGELMERLQLGHIFRPDQQKGSNLSVDMSQDEMVPAAQLLERNRKWYSLYAREVLRATGSAISEEALLEQYTDENGMVAVTPYYCVNTGTTEYLPTTMRKAAYTANGCAAGNSPEEAMVQAFSEIVERNFKCKILSESISTPEIPQEVLKSFPIAWEIITFLENNGLKVTVKDCSLGTKFPVVCVSLIERRTGRYHTHFGAFPDLEIALERTLTESFQGRPLNGIGRYTNFCSSQKDAMSLRNLMSELVKGVSEKTPEFFLGAADLPYNENMGFAAKTNRERLKECLDFFLEQGLDILVRDSSCMGFPTYQIIIPGYSEVFPHRLSQKHNDARYGPAARQVLLDPSKATMGDIASFMMNMSLSNERGLGSQSFLAGANLAASLPANEEAYLMNMVMAHINYTMGKRGDVLKTVNGSVALAPKAEQGYLICLSRFLTLTKNGYAPEKIREILDYFHEADTVSLLYSYLDSGKNPLDPVTLHCDGLCRPECRLYGICTKQEADKLSAIINDKTKALDQTPLAQLIQELYA